ncbi:MAG: glycosyltransferase [Propionibacteriaceae bacterium]|nr:glycosyltransferase [Propionibacteriaceae bacterium]
MAKVLFGSVPAYGIINPSFPLAKALVDQGHEVDYFAHESFRAPIERVGGQVIPWGFYLGGPLSRPEQIVRHGRRMFTDLDAGLHALGPRYDVVVAAGMQPTLPAIQAALDVPVAFCSPVFFQSAQVMDHLAAKITSLPAAARAVLRSVGARRAMGGVFGLAMLGRPLGDVVDVVAPHSHALNITPASRLYQPCADAFDDARHVFMGPTPTLPSSAEVVDSFPLERLRDHDGPIVYGTLGTVFNTWLPFFRTLADAFAGTDTLLVLTTGNEDAVAKVGPVADNVILRSFVPQAEVLAHADVCFTHGGFGSVTDAVSLGVRPILTPMGADQFFNAHRLEELDAGRVLPRSRFTVDAVRRLVDEVRADPALETGLTRLRESFAASVGPDGAARRVAELAR